VLKNAPLSKENRVWIFVRNQNNLRMKMAVDLHFCIKMEVEFINICFELLTITDVTVEPFFMEIKVGGDVNFSAFLIAPDDGTR